MLKDILKSIVANHPIMLSKIYNLFWRNKIKIKGGDNIVNREGAFMNKCAVRILGVNNSILLNGGGQFQ